MKSAKQRQHAAHLTMLAAREAEVDAQHLALRLDARTPEDMNRLATKWSARFRLWFHGIRRRGRG